MSIRILCSAMSDGSMKGGETTEEITCNRERFLARNNVDSHRSVVVHLTYNTDNFRRYEEVTDEMLGEGIYKDSASMHDGLSASQKNFALYLPLADCVGAVLYDEAEKCIMMTHLGRHSLEQGGGRASVEFFVERSGCDVGEVRAWLSPAAGKESYPIHSMSNKGLHEASIEQLLSAGVSRNAISGDFRDTTKAGSLFSHSEFLKGNRETDGRFMIAAMVAS